MPGRLLSRKKKDSSCMNYYCESKYFGPDKESRKNSGI